MANNWDKAIEVPFTGIVGGGVLLCNSNGKAIAQVMVMFHDKDIDCKALTNEVANLIIGEGNGTAT